jgi:ADP-dependent NAD(P)H-hydrate dehydratase / NAD(P)H-hydrate epimerase
MPLQPILPPTRRQPLFGVAATRAIETRSAAALPPHTLMERAGAAVARLALAVAPHARHVWVAAGPGNNGGDGFEAAAGLQRLGKSVHVTLAADSQRLPADAQASLARAQAAGVTIGTDPGPTLSEQDIAIDALLGIGTSRAVQGPLAALIERLNSTACAVLAVDAPSGLDADTGQTVGASCVVARHTLSLLTLKPGLFTGAGRDHAGRVWLDTLDADTDAETPDAWLASPLDGLGPTPARRHAQHKGSFGDVAVVGGAAGMTGAALLAARAAHAAGAGRVFVNLLDGSTSAHDLLRPELMFRPHWAVDAPGVLAASTVVCGCGGGDAVREVLPRLLSRVPRLVLDADALNAIAADPVLQTLLKARADAGRATVLTPHPLEAARLLGQSSAQVQSDRLSAANGLAACFGCVVLLKGSGSVVAAPGRAPSINPTGNASLASAGTGDVLAGWVGGAWAQAGGSPESSTSTAFGVAVATAFQHGAAADASADSPLRAADLIERMHGARR